MIECNRTWRACKARRKIDNSRQMASIKSYFSGHLLRKHQQNPLLFGLIVELM